MMNRTWRLLRWWTVVAIFAFVCVTALLAANLFPDQTWNALNNARKLSDSLSHVLTPEEPPRPPSPGIRVASYEDLVVARLATVGTFAFGGVGVAGMTSQGELDYDFLMARPSALALFEELYREGNQQGKSYALVGIHELAPERFKELATPLNASTDEVVTQHGCIMGRERLADVLRQIEKRQIIVRVTQTHLK